jgi:hypothetical protein
MGKTLKRQSPVYGCHTQERRKVFSGTDKRENRELNQQDVGNEKGYLYSICPQAWLLCERIAGDIFFHYFLKNISHNV